MKRTLLLFSIILMIGCTKSIIPNTSSTLNKGGKIDIVSFYRDNPKYIVEYNVKRRVFYVNLLKEGKKEVTEKKAVKLEKTKDPQDISILGGRPISLKGNSKEGIKTKPEDEYIINARSMLERFNINNYLIKHFILKFRRKGSPFTLGFNLDASKKVVPFVRASNSFDSDRDFATIKDSFSSNLVLELRVLKVLIEEDEQRFLSTWNITMIAKGTLYDLSANKKLWESYPIEHELETATYSSFKESRREDLQENFEDLSEEIAEKLADAFFRK
jgi:hypothetical protein